MISETRYLDVPACAAYLSRTPKAIYRMVERRQIPCIRVDRRIQFDRLAIDRWMLRAQRRSCQTKTDAPTGV